MPAASLADTFLADFDRESQTTRRLLESVPVDKLDWRPHDKSMTLGRLATHIAELPDWGGTIVDTDELDMAKEEFKPVVVQDRAELMAIFEKSREEFRGQLSGRSDEHLLGHWRLLMGEHEVFDLPRTLCIRDYVLSHISHHRAQLGVYFRILDVPLPGAYGPTADEQAGMG